MHYSLCTFSTLLDILVISTILQLSTCIASGACCKEPDSLNPKKSIVFRTEGIYRVDFYHHPLQNRGRGLMLISDNFKLHRAQILQYINTAKCSHHQGELIAYRLIIEFSGSHKLQLLVAELHLCNGNQRMWDSVTEKGAPISTKIYYEINQYRIFGFKKKKK